VKKQTIIVGKLGLFALSLCAAALCILALLPASQAAIIKFAEDHIRGRPLEPEKVAKWLPVITSYAQTGVFLLLLFDLCFFLIPSRFFTVLVKAVNAKPYRFLFFCVILLEAVFFRNIIANPDTLIGTDGDARLVNLILEHWYRVWTFKTDSIGAVPYFAPLKSTLGFTDTFFIYGVPYTLLRLSGLDWLAAQQIVWVAVHVFGGAALVILLKKYFKLPVYAVFAGLVIGNYSNAYYLSTGHPQLLSLSVLPFIAILIFEFYQNFHIRKKRIFYACAVIVSFALLAFSTFYMAYFFALFLTAAHITLFVCKHNEKRNTVSGYIHIIKANIKEILFYAAVCCIALLPFLLTYIPALKEQKGVSMGMLLNTPGYYTFFNVAPENILWGFPAVDAKEGTEGITGFPFITLVLGILAIAAQFKKRDKKSFLDYTVFCAAVSLCVLELLVLRFNNNFTMWAFVNRFLPGASVLRALSRLHLFTAFPLAILIACYLADKISNSKNIKLKNLLVCVLCLFLFLEHQNSAQITRWNKSACREILKNITPPPDDCGYFALVDRRITRAHEKEKEDAFKDSNLDAFMIATFFNLKTINGYSGFDPNGWTQPFDDEEGRTGLREWIDRYGLRNVYIYDVVENRWYLF
jgi:hypothetical protein